VVLVAVRCSISCFALGREKCSRVLVVVSTSSSSVAALSVFNVTQSLWRTRTVNEGSGSGGDLHIVRTIVEVSEVSWIVKVIFVVAGGRQWS
jgi:hypothetical protein